MDTQETRSLVEFLTSVDLLSALTRIDIERLAQSAQSRLLAFGDTVCTAGEAAEGLFIVKSGSIRVFAADGEKETSLGVRKAGEVLGEMVMLREYRHEWSARASGKTELLFIPRSVIGPIVAGNPAARAFVASRVAISSAGGLISHLFDLKNKVGKNELDELIRSVGVKQVRAGKEILKQGSREDRRLYVVRHGEVRVVRHEEGNDYLLATLRKGETFGERACLMRQEQAASVIAGVDTALLVIPEKTAHLIFERNPKVRAALEERIRIIERELQRQKKVAELRKPRLGAGSEVQARAWRERHPALPLDPAGRGNGLRRCMPGDDLQALWHRHDAGQAAGTCQRHDARRDAGQPGAHRRIHWLHHERPAVLLRHDARIRTPVHRALGGLSLRGGVRGVQRRTCGWPIRRSVSGSSASRSSSAAGTACA